MVRTGRRGDQGRGAEGLEARGAVATEEERGDKSTQLPRTEREREGHLLQLPSNQRQKTKKTRIILDYHNSLPHTPHIHKFRVQSLLLFFFFFVRH